MVDGTAAKTTVPCADIINELQECAPAHPSRHPMSSHPLHHTTPHDALSCRFLDYLIARALLEWSPSGSSAGAMARTSARIHGLHMGARERDEHTCQIARARFVWLWMQLWDLCEHVVVVGIAPSVHSTLTVRTCANGMRFGPRGDRV